MTHKSIAERRHSRKHGPENQFWAMCTSAAFTFYESCFRREAEKQSPGDFIFHARSQKAYWAGDGLTVNAASAQRKLSRAHQPADSSATLESARAELAISSDGRPKH